MYWRLDSLPELQHLSDAQRKTLLRKNLSKAMPARLWIGSAARAFCLSMLLSALIAAMLDWAQAAGPVHDIIVLATFIVLLILFTCAIYQFMLIRIRGQLREYLLELRTLGIRLPVCVRCGYALDDEAERCPECGASA